MTTNTHPQRFHALDGLRGLAAVAVMLCHFTQFWGLNWLKNAGSAVDLFFVLSGLVIVYSYGQKIISGMNFYEFMLIRFVRLAPLNIIAVLISGCTFLFMHQALAPKYDITGPILAKAMVLGGGFIPYANVFQWPYGNYASVSGIFPLNLPAWSLFFEMLAYVVCFFYLSLTKKRPGLIFCLGCFCVFIATIIHTKNFNPGWQAGDFYLGTARVMGGFFAGALILKLSATPSLLKYLVAMLTCIFAFYFFAVGDALTVMINTFCLIPLLIWSVRSVRVEGIVKKACVFLGFISYPIYILHIPIVTLLLHQRKLIEIVPSSIRMWVVIVITLGLSTLFGYLDLKVRQAILANRKNH